ncbi:NAD(P)H-dependent oxidoreductase [Curtobacterium sp. MCBD17_021]|uniref:NAD(P)H-dependent oxidoreductase n=1 Tax=Curtobacterium sp. MCBD17_021 TaxID=2175665 RepID=UPI000DA9BE8F|nr:NAD(P)H-dependent oxidoreductase [Curtobacterium sp. MCBD17_021]PZE65386.1 flavodoxin family protein [Curtobacterium sp. MCBD17_021]
MQTLIVTAHPDPDSLTAGIARQLQAALHPGEVELVDLAAEGFDPRFGPADRDAYRGTGTLPADVVREQQRLDTADHVVLVFPVHWWSMPALMKGWIDRVFVNGWAFDIDPAGGTRRNLGRLTVHLLPVAGDAAGTYERHGYEQALRTQIEHGIVDYCGAVRGATAFVYESEQDDDAARRALVDDAVRRIARAVTGAAGAVGAAGVADGQSTE